MPLKALLTPAFQVRVLVQSPGACLLNQLLANAPEKAVQDGQMCNLFILYYEEVFMSIKFKKVHHLCNLACVS